MSLELIGALTFFAFLVGLVLLLAWSQRRLGAASVEVSDATRATKIANAVTEAGNRKPPTDDEVAKWLEKRS